MDFKLRLIFCLGLLAVAALEGPRAGSLLAESARGPYGAPLQSSAAMQAARHGEPAARHGEAADAGAVRERAPREPGEEALREPAGAAELVSARPLQRG